MYNKIKYGRVENMQIFEVKNDTAVILYSTTENNLFLSDFLFIDDGNQTIIAQITDISTTDKENINAAGVKFYLSVDLNSRIKSYDGHTPSRNSDIGLIDIQDITDIFKPKSGGVVWGNHIRKPDTEISTDLKFLSSKLCVICDKAESSKKLLNKILNSLDSNKINSVILDFDGNFSQTEGAAVFGKDFRIPLNSLALEYIYNNELEDLPVSSKAAVQSIIIEVQNYADTLPKGFIPFDLFSQIISDQFQSSRDSGLLIFANKLAQFRQKNIFANKAEEFNKINSGSLAVDISDVETKFHKLILNSTVNLISAKCYLFTSLNDDNADKKIIKKIYDKKNISLIPFCSYQDNNLKVIKQYSENFVLFPPAVKTNSEVQFDYLLGKLTQNDFILYGEGTMFIPLTVTMNKVRQSFIEASETFKKTDIITDKDLDDLDFINRQELSAANLKAEENNDNSQNNQATLTNDDTNSEQISYNVQTADMTPVSELGTDLNKPETAFSNAEILTGEEPKVINYGQNSAHEYLNIIYPNDVTEENNLLVNRINTNSEDETEYEITEEPQNTVNNISETLQNNSSEQDIQKLPPIVPPIESVINIENTEKYDNIEYIENADCEESEEIVQYNGTVEQFGQENQTEQLPELNEEPSFTIEENNEPAVNELPIYSPKEAPKKDIPNFEVGNRVQHAKYGLGNVENIMNYGDKILCCIQFDNFGRKLLDPSLTEIEKLF